MKQLFVGFTIFMSYAFFWNCKPNRTFAESEIALIPKVQKMVLGESSFKFDGNTTFVVESVDQKVIASQFATFFEKATGLKLQVIVGGDKGLNQVYFKTEPVMAPEGYILEVQKKRIEIKAAKPAGFFYATQTLRQLLPVEIERTQKQENKDWQVPVVEITDYPEFKWRGFMLDVARHFFPKEDLFRIIDHLTLHKINTLHLHLVDDQGWRIEIKKYPKLTQVGAWRVDRESKPWSARAKQEPGEKATYGGFYTQEDIKELVAYAQQRFITIVPEIEMPAHSTSALAAYPQFSCCGTPVTVPPGGLWPNTNIYCAGNDSTFLFLQDVLSEVIDLFPSKYIHIGGDEAKKTEWEKCLKCKSRMKNEKLKDASELQGYFVKRMEDFIHSKGRVLIGWDEIGEGGLPSGAAVMSWKGMQGGIDAAKQGHDVVMAPHEYVYLDYYQGPKRKEPLAIGGYLPLKKVYSFDPIPKKLDAKDAKHILGAQANLWTEFVPDLKHAEYMMFPRIAALAEAVWSRKEVRDWSDFSRRIQLFMNRYVQMGINYSQTGFDVSPQSDFDTVKKQLALSLKSELAGLEIHYTTDGTEPNNLSSVYSNPIPVDKTSTVKAIAFADGIPSEKTMNLLINMNKATAKPVKYLVPHSEFYKGSGGYTLVDGVRGDTNHSGGEWQAWESTNMEVVVDLQQATEIHRISVGAFQNAGALIFFPKKVDFFVSPDGVRFTKVGEAVNDVDPLSGEPKLKDFAASFIPVTTGYVKVVAYNLGKVPKGFQGAGENVWMFFDEIAVE
jgi:hexosaminidase